MVDNNLPTGNGNKAPPFRPKYRPQPPRRRRRNCCCICCLWTTVIIIILLLLAAIFAAFFYIFFRPQKPSFSISSLHASQFNLTSNAIVSKFNLTVSAKNPNGKIAFLYDPVSVSISSNDVGIADGEFGNFVHGRKNTTVLKTVLANDGKKTVESSAISALRSEIKNKKNLNLKIQLDTKVKAKIGSVKTKKIRIRVICEGVQFTPPAGKSAATVKTSGVKCQVDPRIKILAWTF